LPRQFAVALLGMAVADEQQRAGLEHRQVNRRPLADL
jgi:hypothetical protein